MLIIKKDQIEHGATKVLAQAQVNPEAGAKAFEEYVKLRYPYLETVKKREKDDAVSKLLAEVNKGPIRIKPMGDTSVKSRLYKKIEKPTVEDGKAITSRLMQKIGRSIPT
jgi:hypothetical protein